MFHAGSAVQRKDEATQESRLCCTASRSVDAIHWRATSEREKEEKTGRGRKSAERRLDVGKRHVGDEHWRRLHDVAQVHGGAEVEEERHQQEVAQYLKSGVVRHDGDTLHRVIDKVLPYCVHVVHQE